MFVDILVRMVSDTFVSETMINWQNDRERTLHAPVEAPLDVRAHVKVERCAFQLFLEVYSFRLCQINDRENVRGVFLRDVQRNTVEVV